MFIKRFIYAFIHDLLYDIWEWKKGKLSLFWGIIFHYGVWLIGFIVMHIFYGIIEYMAFVYLTEFWQFMLVTVLILFVYFLMWWFADRMYGNGDRPTMKGINDKWITK